jgi:hypothetical protein
LKPRHGVLEVVAVAGAGVDLVAASGSIGEKAVPAPTVLPTRSRERPRLNPDRTKVDAQCFAVLWTQLRHSLSMHRDES